MDLDIEMGDVTEGGIDVQIEDLPRASDILSEELEEPGEAVEDEPPTVRAVNHDKGETLIRSKIHISGLDTLHTDDIIAYVTAHFGPVDKIEWIDDGSANLVFDNDSTAGEAITSLSAIAIADVTALTSGESLPAKPFQGKPEISLQVRFSLKSDKKHAGAALRSRYYLLHPEHDPEERRKSQYENRLRYRHREGNRRRSGLQLRDASEYDVHSFEASMYDDAPRQHHPSRSLSPETSTRLPASKNRGKELFSNRNTKRDRSASPRRHHDNDAHIHVLERSSHQNKNLAKLIKSRMSIAKSGKELFPIKLNENGGRLDQLEDSIGSARLKDEDMPKFANVPEASSYGEVKIRGAVNQRDSETNGFSIKGSASVNARELFPHKLGTANAGKELLESARQQRRQKPQDLFL